MFLLGTGRRGLIHQDDRVRIGIRPRNRMCYHAEVLLVQSEKRRVPSRYGASTRGTSRRSHTWGIHTEVGRTDNTRHPAHARIAEQLQREKGTVLDFALLTQG